LSESARFSSRDAKAWLERETGSIFVPVHAKAQKLLQEMCKTVDSLTDTSKMLFDNSAKEIEKRNMKTYGRARALNKLARLFVDRMRQIRSPDKITYDTFSRFVQETQKAFMVTDVDVRNWFPRISPFFILDRRRFLAVFERAKLTLRELGDFSAKEYVKTKTLEETFGLIEKLQALEHQLSEVKEQKAGIAREKAQLEKQIGETQRQISELGSKGGVGQLSRTEAEIQALCSEVKHGLRHLQKPFIKLQSLATHGEGSGLTPEELGKLNQYLEDPFEAFSTEGPRHPLLRQILLKLDRSISEGKLKLKPEKVRKAQQTIESIFNEDSLVGLHQKCSDSVLRRTRLLTSEEVTTVQRDLSKLQEHVEDLKRKKGIIETEEGSIQRIHNETVEKIRNHKSEIEENIFSFTGKHVRID
jgi:hypothetical protein